MGGVKYLLIQRSSGFDVIKAVVDLTLGLKPHVGELHAEQNYLINDFIYCRPGQFDHLDEFDKLLSEGIIRDYYLFKWRGANFEEIRSSGDRVAAYTVIADTAEEMIWKQGIAREKIRVISANGEDMARHDLLTPLVSKDKVIYSVL